MRNRIKDFTHGRISLITVGMLIGLALLLSACAPETAEEPETSPAPPDEAAPLEEPTRESAAPTLTPAVRATRTEPERVPEQTGTAVTGEAPAGLLEAILADLAERLGISSDEIQVIRDEEVVWADGSLGCPQPGMMYTQALVPGYQVVLQAGGQQYDYRATQRGTFFLCEGGGVQRPPAPEY